MLLLATAAGALVVRHAARRPVVPRAPTLVGQNAARPRTARTTAPPPAGAAPAATPADQPSPQPPPPPRATRSTDTPVEVGRLDGAPAPVAPRPAARGAAVPTEPVGSHTIASPVENPAPLAGAASAPVPSTGPAAAKLPLDDDTDLPPRADPAPRFDGLLERLSSSSSDPGDGGAGAALLLRGLRALRGGRNPEASSLGRQYLDGHAGGPFVEDAYAIAIVAAVRSADPRAAEVAAAYLQAFPAGRYRQLASGARARPGLERSR